MGRLVPFRTSGTYECGRYRTACRPVVSDGRAGNPRVLRPGIASDALVELFAVPVVERLDAADHTDAAPEELARARIPADVVLIARAPRDQLQSALAGAERVRDARSRRTGDDGAATNRLLFRLARVERRRQLERARPVEHDEDLLLGRVTVRRGREHSGLELDVREPRPARAGRACRVSTSPSAVQLRLDVGDVDDRRCTLSLGLGPLDRRLVIPGMAVPPDVDVAGDRP